MSASNSRTIQYHEGNVEVQLGDFVQTTFWFFCKGQGRVIYLPGVSETISAFEHSGLQWVGIKRDNGDVFGEVIDPGTRRLLRRVAFISRGPFNAEDKPKPDHEWDH
jgi:hypothetical protein